MKFVVLVGLIVVVTQTACTDARRLEFPITTTPALFEIWERGHSYPVTWKTDLPKTERINLNLTDEFRDLKYLIASGLSGSGTFHYTVPSNQKTSGPYRIRVARQSDDATLGWSAPFFIEEWNWMLDRRIDIHFKRPDGDQQRSVRLPYYSAEGPVPSAISAADMHPKFGWTVLYITPGTAAEPLSWPRIVFYNRYTGILRIFFYYPHIEESWTQGVVRLRRPPVSTEFPALFTFMDEKGREFLDSYDRDRVLAYIGKMKQQEWNYADFLLAGYDPNPPPGAKMEVEISGVLIANLDAHGSINLEQVNVAVSRNFDLEGALNLVGPAWAAFQRTSDALEYVDKRTEPGGSWRSRWYGGQRLNNLINSPLAGSSPWGAAIAAVVGGLFGGGGPAPLHLEGEIRLTGTITEPHPLPEFVLEIPGAQHLGAKDPPIYDELLGIYNLVSMPVVNFAAVEHGTAATFPFPKAYTVYDAFYHRPAILDGMFLVNPLLRSRATIKVATIPQAPRYANQVSGSSEYPRFPDYYVSDWEDGYVAPGNINTRVMFQEVPVHSSTVNSADEWDCEARNYPPYPERCVQHRDFAVQVNIDIPHVIEDPSFLKLYPTSYQQIPIGDIPSEKLQAGDSSEMQIGILKQGSVPSLITVTSGEDISFRVWNHDAFLHTFTIVSNGQEQGISVPAGLTKAFSFHAPQAGDYQILCTEHRDQTQERGTLRVR